MGMTKIRSSKGGSVDGISDQHVWDFIAPMSGRPEIPAPSIVETLQRRRILRELDLSFNSSQTPNNVKGQGSGLRLSKQKLRSKETEAAKNIREELLYESVLRIFEIQLELEKLENATQQTNVGLAPLTLSQPKTPSMLAQKRSSFVLPKLPSLTPLGVFRRSDPDPVR